MLWVVHGPAHKGSRVRHLVRSEALELRRVRLAAGGKPNARPKTAHVHHAARRCGRGLAARGARATAGDACMGATDLQCSNLPLIGCAFLRGASLRER